MEIHYKWNLLVRYIFPFVSIIFINLLNITCMYLKKIEFLFLNIYLTKNTHIFTFLKSIWYWYSRIFWYIHFFHKSNMKRFVNTLWKKHFLEIFQRVLKFWTKYIDFFPKCVVNLHQHFYQDIKCALKKSMYKSQNMDFVLNFF